jgi:RND family efflux transporter MFP subunit
MLAMLCTLPATAATLATAPVRSDSHGVLWPAEGVVEALRHSDLAVQVAGRVTELAVRPGDRVRAGQWLARVDALAAEQGAAASGAQADAARAMLDVARKDYARQQQLFAKHFISAAAMDQAEAQFKAAQAQAKAQLASAGAARTQSGFYTIAAPYAGVVADVPGNVGDMAMPGRTLVSVYDPAVLRVTATVPQAQLAAMVDGQPVRIEFPSLPAAKAWVTASRVTVLPTADTTTHSVEVRLELPAGSGATPGMFARAWLPTAGSGDAHFYVPASAVFRRAEMQAVYVVDAQGRAALRQVKLGRRVGNEVELLAGVAANERVALDPLAAAGR